VPGDTVPPVSIEAQAGSAELCARLASVVIQKRQPGLVQGNGGQRILFSEEGKESRNIDEPVVHRTPL
jgi:hypothetical protein